MNEHRKSVLDASALLALLFDEPGRAVVNDALPGAAISAVNWSEVLQKGVAAGVELERQQSRLQLMGLLVYPFTAEDAALTASLWPRTRSAGLSLADRACLALGARLGVPVLTTDGAWAGIDVGVEVRLLR